MRRFTACFILCLILAYFFFGNFFVKSASADSSYPVNCATHDYVSGSRTTGSAANGAALVEGQTGEASCDSLAERYNEAFPEANLQVAEVNNACIAWGLPREGCTYDDRGFNICDRVDEGSIGSPDGWCGVYGQGGGAINWGDSSYCCSYASGPTPAPTSGPPPPPSCQLTATTEQCNASGTGWDTVQTGMCVSPESCDPPADSLCRTACGSAAGPGMCTDINTACPENYIAGGYGAAYCANANQQCCVPSLTAPTCGSAAGPGACTDTGTACNSFGNYVLGGVGAAHCADDTQKCCVPTATIATPTPTPPATCGSQGGYCVSAYLCSVAGGQVIGATGCSPSVCCSMASVPTSTPTPTPTPTLPPSDCASMGGSCAFSPCPTGYSTMGSSDCSYGAFACCGTASVPPTSSTPTPGGGTCTPGNLYNGSYYSCNDGTNYPSQCYGTGYISHFDCNSSSICVSSPVFCASGTNCQVVGSHTECVVSASAPGWIQTKGADLRWDSGAFNASSLPSGNYTSIAAVSGGMPGIFFSGGKNGLSPCFGPSCEEQASTANWTVGKSPNQDVFTDTHSVIPTSYRFLLETAEGSGIAPVAITAVGSSLAHGIYKVNGDLTINAPIAFGSGNFIILVNGNLNINANITVPIGSTVIFSVSGNITVSPSVGEIQGLYSADNNFTVSSSSNCAVGTADNPLNIAGTAVANAGRGGGTFINSRTLCAGNSTNPSVTFTERPDFLLNYPSIVTQTTRVWQDVAP